MTQRLPLQDIRIIAVEQYGAGPWGSVHLADLGAEVIKIEEPSARGDVGRYVPPYAQGEDSLFFEVFNRNKRSLSLDLTTAEGRAVFEDLVREADAVYSNLRGDVPEKIKITYDDLKHLNPAIVCCSLSGFGMTGPRRKEPGYDYILQGLGGWMDVTGEPDGPPTKSGLSMVDYSGGMVAAISLLAGIHAARRDGVGMDCDVSLYDTAISMLTYPGIWALNTDFTPHRTRHSAHPSLVPFQVFQTADSWIVVGCAKEKFWQRLAPVLGHPEWADSEEYGTFAARERNKVALLAELEEIFHTRTVGGVARRSLPGRHPVRADQHRPRGARGGAHRRPRADRGDRPPGLRDRAAPAHLGQRGPAAHRAPAGAAAQRALHRGAAR